MVWKSISLEEIPDIDFVDVKYLFIAVFLIFLSYSTACFQWKLLLVSQNIKITYGNLLRFYFVGSFFNNFMPGNVGGDIKKVYDIKRNSEETVGAAISATFFDRLFGLYMLCGFALLVGTAFFWEDPSQKYFLMPSLLIFLSFSLGFCALFSRRFGKLFKFLGERVLHLHSRFQSFKTAGLFLQLLVISAVTQSLRVLSHYFCALSIGVDISISWYFYYIPLIAIVSALPISIGGFGPRELMAQTLFTRIGVGTAESVVMQLLAFGANLAVSFIGFFLYLTETGNSQENKNE